MEPQIAFAACRGTYHIQSDLPCQDSAGGRKWGDFAAVVLADGAGSCPYAQQGAMTAVETTLKLLEEKGADWICGETGPIPCAVISACLESFAQNPYEPQEQACTLLFCLTHADGRYVCGHLGDGYVFRISGETACVLSAPENGESLNETVFVTSPKAEEHFRLTRGVLQRGEAILLCSDGAGEALYARDDGHCAPALLRMGAWMGSHSQEEISRALAYNLNSVFREKSQDDMSIALVSCRS